MNEHSLKSVAKNVLVGEGEQLINAADRISDRMEIACDIITNHNGKIVISGMGKSGLIAQKIAATLCSIGNEAVFLHPAEAVHGDLGIYAPGDPTILISKSGATDEIVRLIPILKEFNSPLIGILGNMNSILSNEMDLVLDASVSKEVDPLGIVPTSSTTLTLAIGDALAAVLMANKNFKREDFAKLHPAGDLGRRLKLKVKDIMQPIDKVAVVDSDDDLRNTVIKMTEKPQGAALVLNNEKILMGIITEGDLRRSLANEIDIDNCKANEVMSANPITIKVDSSLSEVISLMENRESQISVLPVVDQSNICLGLIRIHDIYQTQLL
jgi:arabinose-5-phosphate isomerase